MPYTVRRMTIGQRFQLGILCEEFGAGVAVTLPRPPADDAERAAVVAGTAAIARFLADERIGCERFTPADKNDYRQAYFAAVLMRHAGDYEPGTLAHDVLVAAGLRPADALPAAGE